MMNLDKYIEKDRIKREKIAMDIKYGVITAEDIDLLVADPRIHSAFIGNQYDDKKPKSGWNQQYLDELSYGVTSEGFNEDYLRYLCEVADFVRKQNSKNKRNTLWLIIGVVIIVVVIVALLCVRSGNSK